MVCRFQRRTERWKTRPERGLMLPRVGGSWQHVKRFVSRNISGLGLQAQMFGRVLLHNVAQPNYYLLFFFLLSNYHLLIKLYNIMLDK